jgi:hypothetical protein
MSRLETEQRTTSLGRILDWWHDTRDRWARLAELNDLPAHELDRIAADMGVATPELLAASTRPGGTQGLLEKRLAALELDPEDIRRLSPMLLRDLEHTCGRCSERQRCSDDMKISPLAPGWESFCPNSGTLRTLA